MNSNRRIRTVTKDKVLWQAESFLATWSFKPDQMPDIQDITSELLKFRNDRDWEQFHNPKDLSLALSIEAAELLELFLWKNPDEVDREKVKEELADVFSFAFLLAKKYDLDVKQIILQKIQLNAVKYPINKAKGSAKKYDEL